LPISVSGNRQLKITFDHMVATHPTEFFALEAIAMLNAFWKS